MSLPLVLPVSANGGFLAILSLRLEKRQSLYTFQPPRLLLLPLAIFCTRHFLLPLHPHWLCYGSSSRCLVSSRFDHDCGLKYCSLFTQSAQIYFSNINILTLPLSFSSPTLVSRHTSASHSLSQLCVFAPAVSSIWYTFLLILCVVHTLSVSLALSLLLL